MKIYLVLFQDRHADPGVYSTADKQKAINYARTQARNLCRHMEDFDETMYDAEREDGWIYRAGYSCENDSISVKEADIESLPEIFTI